MIHLKLYESFFSIKLLQAIFDFLKQYYSNIEISQNEILISKYTANPKIPNRQLGGNDFITIKKRKDKIHIIFRSYIDNNINLIDIGLFILNKKKEENIKVDEFKNLENLWCNTVGIFIETEDYEKSIQLINSLSIEEFEIYLAANKYNL